MALGYRPSSVPHCQDGLAYLLSFPPHSILQLSLPDQTVNINVPPPDKKYNPSSMDTDKPRTQGLPSAPSKHLVVFWGEGALHKASEMGMSNVSLSSASITIGRNDKSP